MNLCFIYFIEKRVPFVHHHLSASRLLLAQFCSAGSNFAARLQVVILSSLNQPRNGGTNHAGPQTDRSESCGHKLKQRTSNDNEDETTSDFFAAFEAFS